MSDERERLLKDVDRGARAEMLQAEAKEILDELERDAFDAIRAGEGNDTEGRENCYMQIRAIDLLRGKLISRISDAQLAREALKALPDDTDEDDDA